MPRARLPLRDCRLQVRLPLELTRSLLRRFAPRVRSPARRASRKILERMHEQKSATQIATSALAPHTLDLCRFLCLLDARERITEYNQEVCRVNSYDGGSSLIRSFPSAVGVRSR